MHGKTSIIFSKKTGILKNLPKTFEATRYHSLIIDKKTLSKDLEITAETKDGLIVKIPITSIVKSTIVEITEKNGKVLRADPNKSLYIFAPSAFPIESNKSYCRDFCVFFPSYNRGFNNNFSLQLGAFVAPGIPIDEVPLVLSGKFSLPKVESKSNLKFSIKYMIQKRRMPQLKQFQ